MIDWPLKGHFQICARGSECPRGPGFHAAHKTTQFFYEITHQTFSAAWSVAATIGSPRAVAQGGRQISHQLAPAVVPPVAPPTDICRSPPPSPPATRTTFSPTRPSPKARASRSSAASWMRPSRASGPMLASRGQELMPSDLPKIAKAQRLRFFGRSALLKVKPPPTMTKPRRKS